MRAMRPKRFSLAARAERPKIRSMRVSLAPLEVVESKLSWPPWALQNCVKRASGAQASGFKSFSHV